VELLGNNLSTFIKASGSGFLTPVSSEMKLFFEVNHLYRFSE